MPASNKRVGPVVVLEFLLAVAMAAVAYSQVYLPLTGEGGLPLIVHESYRLSLLPLAIGLAIAVGAEVFRQGTSLRADVDGLV